MLVEAWGGSSWNFHTPQEHECFKGRALLPHCQTKTELASDCPTETRGKNCFVTEVAAPFAEGCLRAGKQVDKEKRCLNTSAPPSPKGVQMELEVTGSSGEKSLYFSTFVCRNSKRIMLQEMGNPQNLHGAAEGGEGRKQGLVDKRRKKRGAWTQKQQTHRSGEQSGGYLWEREGKGQGTGKGQRGIKQYG